MDITSFVARVVASTETTTWNASLDITTYVVYAAAVLLLVAVLLLIRVVFFKPKRAQKLAFVFTLLAVPLFLIYYDDRVRALWPRFAMRSWAGPIVERYSSSSKFDPGFHSDIVPAIMVAGTLLVHLIVVQRLASRPRLVRIANLTSTFFAGSIAATMLGGTIVSTFHLGWPGALGIGAGFALVYLGALALVAAMLELIVELSKLAGVWLQRKLFTLATLITRAANWISSLGNQLGFRALIDRIRAARTAQEGQYLQQQDSQDQRLLEAYIRDLDRKRQARLRAAREKLGEDDSIAELRAYVEGAPPSDPMPAQREPEPTMPAYDPFAATIAANGTVESTEAEPTTQQQ